MLKKLNNTTTIPTNKNTIKLNFNKLANKGRNNQCE